MSNSAQTYRSDIQGLRALAVLAVIAFHYNKQLLPGGFIGVDIFLVISGYLITNILLQKKTNSGYTFKSTIKKFYISRIQRIFPAYFAMLVLVSITSAILFIGSDFDFYAKSLKKSLYFFSNNYFSSFGNYFAPGVDEQPLLHTWSLAVEMQFYMLQPLLVLCLPNKWLKRLLPIILISCLLAAEYMLRKGAAQSTYYALYARIPEFLVGSLLAINQTGTKWTTKKANITFIFGLLLILISTLILSNANNFPGLLSVLPITGAGFIIAAKNARYSSLLRTTPLVWLGALSYSLYLWHWPILAFIRYYTGTYALNGISSLIFILATLTLAITSYYWVEQRFHGKQRTKLSSNKWLTYSTLCLLILGLASIKQLSTKLNTYIAPSQLGIEYSRYADPTEICHGEIHGDCIKGNTNSTKQILVIGDSHAAMLNRFFDQLGKELDFSARVITASSCVTIPDFDYERLPEWAQKPCISQIQYAKSYIESANTIIIAGAWDYQTKSQNFINALNRFLSENDKTSKRIYIISQVPKLSINVQRLLRFRSLGLPTKFERDDSYKQANLIIENLTKNHTKTQFIDLSELNLFKDAPFYTDHQGITTPIYLDDNHLNQQGVYYYQKQSTNVFMGAFN